MYYSMPLADSINGVSAEKPDYRPKTLESLISDKFKEGKSWFTKHEILDIAIPIANALKVVSACKLTHRDVKPENIIYINGNPHLSDFGLLSEDTASISRSGSYDYTPPEWFKI